MKESLMRRLLLVCAGDLGTLGGLSPEGARKMRRLGKMLYARFRGASIRILTSPEGSHVSSAGFLQQELGGSRRTVIVKHKDLAQAKVAEVLEIVQAKSRKDGNLLLVTRSEVIVPLVPLFMQRMLEVELGVNIGIVDYATAHVIDCKDHSYQKVS